MKVQYVHLRVHTEYSLVDGLLRLNPLMKALPEREIPAVAVTDFCNLFSAVKLYQYALEGGIKPIFGSEVCIVDGVNFTQAASLVFLCRNLEGYKNLTELISKGYLEGQHQGRPYIQKAWLRDLSSGLIALSGGQKGEIGRLLISGEIDRARQIAQEMTHLYPQAFYIELTRVGRPDEALYNERAVKLAEELDIPVVATNEVCFLDAEDFEAHEARVCIHDGQTLADPRRVRRYTKAQYLKSAQEMSLLFKDIPEALENTVEIAKRCNVTLDLGHNYLPNFPVPQGQTIESYFENVSKEGLIKRLPQILLSYEAASHPEIGVRYEARLRTEIDVINRMGFAGYFLIVADFIQWAKNNGVPVGPGRGSGAGSLVAYALNITDLDPLPYDLLFERFLNPERVSMPDFDIDFCMEGRDRVIEYVAQKYGRLAVSQIITFGTMAAKAVVRDVGRVLGHPYGFVDTLAKLIPFEIGITLEKALQDEPELRRRHEEEDEVKELFSLALKLEGITRNAGKHAGGVVIAPSKLTDFTALYCEEGSSQLVTQFDKDDVEAVGLVKFDFLGLRTLTIIDWALKTINQQQIEHQLPPIDISMLGLDDEKTFSLLKSCQTTAVFQLESRGMKDLISRLQPDCFEDIVALVALFRPGPLQSGMVEDFIDRKHGRAPVIYPHPDLEPILKPTYGVIVYQEQVMQIAQVLANYTLGAADLLRRAMGKKKPEEMAKQREIFTEGAASRGVDAETAKGIFDLMEMFAGYGFNKSHSAAYALVAYQTAWLKAHHQAAFMAAVMSSDMDNTDKVVNFIEECEMMQLQVIPPSINRSAAHFKAIDNTAILYGLGAIKGVGENAIQSIEEARLKEGPFLGLFNLCERVDTRKVNRRVLETLIRAGALDCFEQERSTLLNSLEHAIKRADQFHQNVHSGQGDLFALMEEVHVDEDYQVMSPWPIKEKLQGEKEALGFYLSGHPSDVYCREFKTFIVTLAELDPHRSKKAMVCGQVTSFRKVLTKRGKTLVILGLEDRAKRMDIVIFNEVFESLSFPLKVGMDIVIEGEISVDEFRGGVKMVANSLMSIASARTRFAKSMTLHLNIKQDNLVAPLKDILNTYIGGCVLQIKYENYEASGLIFTNKKWRVEPCDDLISALQNLLGEGAVQMVY